MKIKRGFLFEIDEEHEERNEEPISMDSICPLINI